MSCSRQRASEQMVAPRTVSAIAAIAAASVSYTHLDVYKRQAVFIANGLQLILAVLLIVLGLTIVIHSFKSLSLIHI